MEKQLTLTLCGCFCLEIVQPHSFCIEVGYSTDIYCGSSGFSYFKSYISTHRNTKSYDMVGIEYDTGSFIKKLYYKIQGAGKSNKKLILISPVL